MPQFFILASRENRVAKNKMKREKREGRREDNTKNIIHKYNSKNKGNNANFHRITCFFQPVLQ